MIWFENKNFHRFKKDLIDLKKIWWFDWKIKILIDSKNVIDLRIFDDSIWK